MSDRSWWGPCRLIAVVTEEGEPASDYQSRSGWLGSLSLSGALDGLASPGHLFLQRADSSGETVGVGGGPWCSCTPPPHSQPGLSLSCNQTGTAWVRLIKASRVLIKLAVQPPPRNPTAVSHLTALATGPFEPINQSHLQQATGPSEPISNLYLHSYWDSRVTRHLLLLALGSICTPQPPLSTQVN